MDECCSNKGKEIAALALKAEQRRVLMLVLAINATMFFVEFTAGYMASSSSLMADSVDMLGDALVYVLSLFALHRGIRWEAGAALAKGLIIMAFFVLIVIETGLKIFYGTTPISSLMLIFGGAGAGSQYVVPGAVMALLRDQHQYEQHVRMLAQRRRRQPRRAAGSGGRLRL